MDKTRTIGQKKLVIRDPFFLVPENVCQSSIHSHSSVESYRSDRRRPRRRQRQRQRQRQRSDIIVKSVFFLIQGVSKRGDFPESAKVNFHIKSIPFLMRM